MQRQSLTPLTPTTDPPDTHKYSKKQTAFQSKGFEENYTNPVGKDVGQKKHNDKFLMVFKLF